MDKYHDANFQFYLPDGAGQGAVEDLTQEAFIKAFASLKSF